MAFRLIKDATDTQTAYLPISSLTLVAGQVLELDLGATTWTSGTHATIHWQRKAVTIEAATTAATEVKAILVNDTQLWEADAENNGAATANGDRMLLGTGGITVNNTGTDDASQEA